MNHHEINHKMDKDIPVWRYMDMSKFSLLVCRKKIWFSRADLLGDDHEGSFPKCMINKRELRWPEEELQNRFKRGSREGRKHTYVSCWTEQDPESFAMWKIYTPNATGLAIQSNIGKLAKCFIRRPKDLFERLDAKIEPIEYDLDLIKDIFDEDNFNKFQHKLKAYSFEKEIRALITFIPTVEEPRIGFELEVDLDILIDKIYISHRFGDGLEQFVKNILHENHLDKKVVKPSFVRTPAY